MQHFSCDSCQGPLGEHRYVIEIDVEAVQPVPALTADDLDDDHLDQLAAHLQAAGETPYDALTEPAPATQHFRYDLCPRCHDRYRRDPLGVRRQNRLSFSQN